MTIETPLRAERDSRLVARGDEPLQAGLFSENSLGVQEDAGVLVDYRQRYGLQEDPFSNDYSFPLFTGAGRRELLDKLLHLAQFSDSLLAVIGGQGVGKTRVAHGFMDSLSEQDLVSYLPLDANSSTEVIVAAIVEDFALDLHGEPIVENLVAALDHWLTMPATNPDQLACVVIDNAHLLSSETLELFVSLLRRHPNQNRLHFILFGEAALSLRLSHFIQQGVSVNSFELPVLTPVEVVDYLNFRMEMADYLGPEVFNESMVSPWYRQAEGDLTLIHQRAREQLLQSVITPSGAIAKNRGLPVLHIMAIAGLITLGAISLLYLGDDEPRVETAAVPVAPTLGRDLTRTTTPVEPVMPSLPQTVKPRPATGLPSAHQAAPTQPAPTQNPLPTSSTQPVSASVQDAKPMDASKVEQVAAVAPPPVVEQAPQPQVSPQPPKAVAPPEPTPAPVAKPAVGAKSVVSTPVPKALAGKSADEQKILTWPKSGYTIQLLGVSSETAARGYVASQSNREDLLLFRSLRQGKPWFVVVTGRFNTPADARAAIAKLPAEQRDAGPWPREIKAVQTDILAVR